MLLLLAVIVVVDPRNPPWKFGKNLVGNSWDIADVEFPVGGGGGGGGGSGGGGSGVCGGGGDSGSGDSGGGDSGGGDSGEGRGCSLAGLSWPQTMLDV